MKNLLIIFFLLPLFVFSEDFILVKQVWGKVSLIQSKKSVDLANYVVLNLNNKIKLFDKDSRVWIRDNEENNFLLEFNDKKSIYSYKDLMKLIEENNLETKLDKSFANKLFSFITAPETKNERVHNGMIISSKTGLHRNFNDSNIITIADLNIIEGYPMTINFSNFFKGDDVLDDEFSITIKDKFSNKTLLVQSSSDTYFNIKTNNIPVSFNLNWKIEISSLKSSKIIKGNISSFYLNPEMKSNFNILREKALTENLANDCLYQMIFIESLMSNGLFANASYYLDFFISQNNNSKLISYKTYNFNN